MNRFLEHAHKYNDLSIQKVTMIGEFLCILPYTVLAKRCQFLSGSGDIKSKAVMVEPET